MNRANGFGVIAVFVALLVVVLIGGAGYYVWSNRDGSSDTQTSTSDTDKPTQMTKYLDINELGVRLKLTDGILDAYYSISNSGSRNGQPIVHLSTHSLDVYEGCVASPDSSGVALVSTFRAGDSDDVIGDYATAFPKAPKIDDLYYYIQGNQYDCTLGKDQSTYSKAKSELTDSYSTIEAIPAQ